MKAEAKLQANFMDWIRAMSIIQFHAFSGTLFDEMTSTFKKWNLWPGVRGYPGQREMLESFATYKYIWTLKARQLGGSEGAAFHAIQTAITSPRSEIIVISKQYEDASYLLNRRVLTQLEAMYKLEFETGKRFPWPKYTASDGIIRFENGSWFEAVSSDNEQVRSRSPRLVLFDEIRTFLHKNAEELYSGIRPAIARNPRGQLIGISTAKFGSWYNETTKKIMTDEIKGFKFLFMPDDTDPQRTPEWREEEGAGYSHPALFSQEHPLEPEDCFISREGAVFTKFDPRLGGKHINPVELNWGYKYIIGYDHGRQHPAVLLLCLFDTYSNHLYVFDEVFCRNLDIPEVALEIRKKMNFYKTQHASPDPVLKIADAACFSEDGKRTTAALLKEHSGITFTPAHRFDILTSIDRLSTRFANGLITIDPRCKQAIKQIHELKYKREAGIVKKESVVDVEDDAVDVLRYIDAEINPSIRRKPKVQTLEQQLNSRARMGLIKSAFQSGNPQIDELEATWQAG